MRKHFYRRSILTAAVLATSSIAAAQQYQLQRSNSISLTDVFFSGATPSLNGSNPISVAFDGTAAYVGGFNNVSAGTVGIVRVDNPLAATTGKTELPGTRWDAPQFLGFGGLAARAGGVYAIEDGGGPFLSRLKGYDSNGNQTWAVDTGAFSGSGYRPSGIAIDPLGDNGQPMLGMVGVSAGRRVGVRLADGALIYAPSGGPSPLGDIINTSGGVTGFTYRGLAFDSAGNIATAANKGWGYGLRDTLGGTNWNRFTNGAGTVSVVDVVGTHIESTNPGAQVAFLEGLGTSQSILALSGRYGGSSTIGFNSTMTDRNGVVQNIDTRDVLLRYNTGSIALAGGGTLTQSILTGAEDFFTGGFADETKGFATGKDANNNPVLLVVDFSSRRLDVYQVEPTWTGGSGDWDDSGSWRVNLIADGRTQNARFGPQAIATNVTLNSARTTKLLRFDSASPYTIGGTGTLTLDGPDAFGAHISVEQGTGHTVAVPLVTIKGTDLRVPVGSSLTLSGGISGAGLTKRGLGTAEVKHFRVSATNIAERTLRVLPNGGPDGASRTGDLAIANTGGDYTATLDLTNNGLVVATTPLADVKAALLYGRNGGAWNGTGLTSSTAAANSTVAAVGYGLAGDIGATTFLGQTVDPDDAILRYTRIGDANLNGTTEIGDFALLAANFNTTGSWTKGDFNYDDGVNISDFALLAANFNQIAPADLPRGAAVPEPAAVSILAVVGLATARRRRA